MGRSREKACDRCHLSSNILYRVQIDESAQWIFVCDRCWALVSENNSHYVYGGTWKAKKRH